MDIVQVKQCKSDLYVVEVYRTEADLEVSPSITDQASPWIDPCKRTVSLLLMGDVNIDWLNKKFF